MKGRGRECERVDWRSDVQVNDLTILTIAMPSTACLMMKPVGPTPLIGLRSRERNPPRQCYPFSPALDSCPSSGSRASA